MKDDRLGFETHRRVAALFSPADRPEAERLLDEECGTNLPFAEGLDATELERVRFSVLKLSGGDLSRLREAIEWAKVDSRDVMVAAGFGSDVRAHVAWFPGTRDD